MVQDGGGERMNRRAYQTADGIAMVAPDIPTMTDPASYSAIAADAEIVAILTDAPQSKVSRVYVAPPNGAFTLTSLPLAKFGALAALHDRALIVLPTSEGVKWYVFDASGQELGTGVIDTNASSLAAVALHDDFIIATAQHKSITLYRFDGASGPIQAQPAAKAVLPQQMGNASLEAFDGNFLSLAAARDRVLVAWMQGQGPLPIGSPIGGNAMLACAPH